MNNDEQKQATEQTPETFPANEPTTSPEVPKAKSRRGFAAMSPDKVKEIASKGGKRAHEVGTAHRFTSDEARLAGQKGGNAPHVSRGTQGKKKAAES